MSELLTELEGFGLPESISVLEQLLAHRPTTRSALLKIRGFGPHRLRDCGDQVLARMCAERRRTILTRCARAVRAWHQKATPSTAERAALNGKTVLVIGGTQFMGRHTIERLRRAGIHVVLVNRGRTRCPFGDLSPVHCDRRTEEFSQLLRCSLNRHWDAVIDFVAFNSADVEPIVSILNQNVGHYVQISSDSVSH